MLNPCDTLFALCCIDFYPASEIHPSFTIMAMAPATVAVIGLGMRPASLLKLRHGAKTTW